MSTRTRIKHSQTYLPKSSRVTLAAHSETCVSRRGAESSWRNRAVVRNYERVWRRSDIGRKKQRRRSGTRKPGGGDRSMSISIDKKTRFSGVFAALPGAAILSVRRVLAPPRFSSDPPRLASRVLVARITGHNEESLRKHRRSSPLAATRKGRGGRLRGSRRDRDVGSAGHGMSSGRIGRCRGQLQAAVSEEARERGTLAVANKIIGNARCERGH